MVRAKPTIDGFRGDSVDIPLAVGTILGTRSFLINDDGELTGVSVKNLPYKTGENVAVCAAPEHNHPEELTDDSADLSEFLASPHDMNDCEHGFWAYFDQKNSYSDDNTVSGVLEGYGEVIVGEKGFRSSKARVRALVEPEKHYSMRNFPFMNLAWIIILGYLLVANYEEFISGISEIEYGADFLFYLIIVPALLIQTTVLASEVVGSFRAKYSMKRFNAGKGGLKSWQGLFGQMLIVKRMQQKLTAFEKVRQNYPDVPVFSSYQSMLSRFPELGEQRNKWKQN